MLSRILLVLLFSAAGASAQLTWGVNGAGGAGTWDTTTSNWFNGASSVTWDNNIAIFGGSSGTVSMSASVSVQAKQLIFNTAGYVISSNVLTGPTDSSFNVTANADATINSTIQPVSFGNGLATIVKDGAGTLNLGGQVTNYTGIQINNGNLDFNPTSSVTYEGTTVTISNAPLAALTLGTNFIVGNLNGGGSSGGIIRPESTGSITLTFNGGLGSGSFAGALQDNGSAILSVSTSNGPIQTFTGVNTYSGSTQINDGTITFAGLGSAVNTSAIMVSSGGTLVLDNSGTNVGNRISNLAPITLSGALTLRGNSAAPSSETAGALLAGGSFASVVTLLADPAQPSSITFSSIGQASATALGVTLFRGANLGAAPAVGTANVLATTAPALIGGGGAAGSTNISIMPFAFGDFSPTGNGTTFVTYGANGIRPLTDAEYSTNSFSVGTNVSADRVNSVSTLSVNALRLKNGATVNGAGILTVGSGSVLSLPGNSSINTAQLNFGTNPILFEIQGTTTIASAISGTDTTRGFAKFGAGRLMLTGANTYSGQTDIAEGVLNIQNGSALGAASAGTIIIGGAALEIQGGISVGNEALTVLGTGGPGSSVFSSTGALRSISGNNTWGGNVTVNQGVIGVDSGSLTITGSVTATFGLTKVGNGSLVLSNVIPPGGGSLAINGGGLTFTVTSGSPSGLPLSLRNGALDVAPSGSGSSISLLHNSSSSYNGDSAIEVNKGANTSLTYAFSSAIVRGSVGSSLVVIPGSGLGALGVSEKLRIAMMNTNGIVPTSVVGQDNDANRSGTFLTFNATNGLIPVTYAASTDLNTAGGTAVFQANSDQTLTATRPIYALQDNSHIINLGTNQLQVGSGGVILNGGTIQNGTLNFNSVEGTIYTNLAGGTISGPIFALSAVTLFGPGKLTISSNTNTVLGTITVNGGILNLQGTISSTTVLSPTAIVTGTGKNGRDFGGGTISPGNSGPGILTARTVDIQESPAAIQAPFTNFAFEFTKLGLPNFSSAASSGNDVLHLTNNGAGISGGLLGVNNEIDLYFNTGFSLQTGQTYDGGFFTDNNAAFDSSIQGANYKVFVSDPLGATTFDGVKYSVFTSSPIAVSSVPQTADFGSGPVNGYVMQVQVVPEPASYLTFAGGVASLALLRRHRRRFQVTRCPLTSRTC